MMCPAPVRAPPAQPYPLWLRSTASWCVRGLLHNQYMLDSVALALTVNFHAEHNTGGGEACT